ncbi:hypothetical protein [Microtetraspora malaysiensis]|nr:hypothetical protein [Microtetraspora malaysiensis]
MRWPGALLPGVGLAVTAGGGGAGDGLAATHELNQRGSRTP